MGLSECEPVIYGGKTAWCTNTHSVVFFDVSTDVEQQFVADVDRVVDGPALTGDVAASHQAGLQV